LKFQVSYGRDFEASSDHSGNIHYTGNLNQGKQAGFNYVFCGRSVSEEDLSSQLSRYLSSGKVNELPEISGCFNVFIEDADKEKFYIVSDFSNSNPVYYSRTGQNTVLASDSLYSLIKKDGVSRKVGKEALGRYLKSPETFLSGGRCLFKDVQCTDPSTICCPQTSFTQRTDLSPETRQGNPAEIMENMLRDSVENIVQQSDEEHHIWLSGGLDSVLITKLFCENMDGKPKTVTFGTEEDDLVSGRRTAQELGTDHTEVRYDEGAPTDTEIRRYGQPFHRPLYWPVTKIINETSPSFSTGVSAISPFPVGLKNIRILDRLVKLPAPSAPQALKKRVKKYLGRQASAATNIVGCDQPAAKCLVDSWTIGEEEIQSCLQHEYKGKMPSKKVGQKWSLERFSRVSERFNYLQIRERGVPRYNGFLSLGTHRDPFATKELVEYSLSLPMSRKRDRKILKQIARRNLSNSLIQESPSGHINVLKKMWLNASSAPDFSKQLEGFADRDVLNRKGKKLLLKNSATSVREKRFKITCYMLERWIQAMGADIS
jgi:hypothetical protein